MYCAGRPKKGRSRTGCCSFGRPGRAEAAGHTAPAQGLWHRCRHRSGYCKYGWLPPKKTCSSRSGHFAPKPLRGCRYRSGSHMPREFPQGLRGAVLRAGGSGCSNKTWYHLHISPKFQKNIRLFSLWKYRCNGSGLGADFLQKSKYGGWCALAGEVLFLGGAVAVSDKNGPGGSPIIKLLRGGKAQECARRCQK
jgi:hypothetical protein